MISDKEHNFTVESNFSKDIMHYFLVSRIDNALFLKGFWALTRQRFCQWMVLGIKTSCMGPWCFLIAR